jgi:hypothetical protein
MVYFMREAKGVDDFPKKEASGKREKEQERKRERAIERKRHCLELRAHENFSPLNSS